MLAIEMKMHKEGYRAIHPRMHDYSLPSNIRYIRWYAHILQSHLTALLYH